MQTNHSGLLSPPWANDHLAAFIQASRNAGLPVIVGRRGSLDVWARVARVRGQRQRVALSLYTPPGHLPAAKAIYHATLRQCGPSGLAGAGASFDLIGGWPLSPPSTGNRPIEPEYLDTGPAGRIPVVSLSDLRKHLKEGLARIYMPEDPSEAYGFVDAWFAKSAVRDAMATLVRVEKALAGMQGVVVGC